MLKMIVGCTVACIISTSATWALAAEVATPKVAGASLQKMNYTAQKSVYNQLGRVGMPARDRAVNPPTSLKVMPESAQFGLLLTALLCFVARASRRKV